MRLAITAGVPCLAFSPHVLAEGPLALFFLLLRSVERIAAWADPKSSQTTAWIVQVTL